jgi:dTDP-4-dehydrorhamnose 3,5-epimerase
VIFTETAVRGVFVLEPERMEDVRGFFARTWSAKDFEKRGLDPRLVQCSISFNRKAGTLRGMHYQLAPHAEDKLVRCTMGSAHDVAVDLRPDSPTYLRHASVVLSASARNAIYIPQGCAHGFQTLEDATEIFYQMSAGYEPSAAGGVRWDDPAFGIAWPPAAERIMVDRDRNYPDYRPERNHRA